MAPIRRVDPMPIDSLKRLLQGLFDPCKATATRLTSSTTGVVGPAIRNDLSVGLADHVPCQFLMDDYFL
jgi:hypothetical protein